LPSIANHGGIDALTKFETKSPRIEGLALDSQILAR
jgi:hypothetical protein